MKRDYLRYSSLALFLLGTAFLLNSEVNMTGAVIGTSNSFSGFSYFIGFILMICSVIVFTKGETIDNIFYENHSLERMRERKLFPSVIKDAIEHGEHYKLKNTYAFGEAKGASEVYVSRHVADIAPGSGGIGERIIEVRPGANKKLSNVLVLTDGKVIKTAYVRNDVETEAFFKKYIR